MKRRVRDLTGEMEIIGFAVVKHVKKCRELACLGVLEQVLLAQFSSLAPSCGLQYINCGATVTPRPLRPRTITQRMLLTLSVLLLSVFLFLCGQCPSIRSSLVCGSGTEKESKSNN